ncbi:MAG: transglutaminase TgpA family protein [Actinomycetota bacterium]
MSTPERGRAERRNRVVIATLLAAFASVIALWPYTGVIQAGPWTGLVAVIIVAVGLVGAVTREVLARSRDGLRSLVTLLAQVIVVVCLLTALVAGGTAAFGILPTVGTLGAFGALATQALSEVAFGSAPLTDTLALRAMIAVGFAVVAILLDHLVSLRLALLSALFVAAVGVVPTIITLGDPDVIWFIALGILALLLLRHRARHDRRAPHRTSGVIAVGIGVCSLVLSVAVAPALPISATWAGVGTSQSLNPSLRLGEDLRQPSAAEVMTVATEDAVAPYLRIATLSFFDGRVWRADESDLQPLDEGFGEPEWGEDVQTRELRTSVRILNVSSSWLPVPYPATEVNDLSGRWNVMPSNRTVVSRTADAAGQDYTVTSTVLEPTLEQIRASTVNDSGDVRFSDSLPDVISDTARTVTADQATDYDRLVALQDWFRSEFTYSLETPVEEGFDGTGADAVETFLEVRSGYCIHFAGAFALMAQSLDMPVRIVVGYLPGRVTDERRGADYVYSVTSDQLHAWPEVHFPDIGWVPFEPTASLGVPTEFLPGETEGGSDAPSPSTPAPTTEPSTAPTDGPDIEREDETATSGGTDTLRGLDPTPVLLVSAGILLALLLPGFVRAARRAGRLRRARHGDSDAAWAELRDSLIDLGMPASDADTPRGRAARLVDDRGVDAAAVAELVTAVERRSYARTPDADTDLAAPLSTVLAELRASTDGRARLAALLLPRSLITARTATATERP